MHIKPDTVILQMTVHLPLPKDKTAEYLVTLNNGLNKIEGHLSETFSSLIEQLQQPKTDI